MYTTKFRYLFTRTRAEKNIIQPHKHDFCEFVYYRSGCGKSTINDCTYKYIKNSFAFIPSGIPHEEISNDKTELSCLLFNSTVCKNVSGLFEDNNNEFITIVDAICNEYDRNSKNSVEIIDHYLSILEFKLLRLSSCDPYIKKQKDPMLDSTYNYILNYYNSNIRIPELAKMIGYSTDRYRHIFKERYGISPKNLIITTQIESSKNMIKENRNGEMNLEQIAKQCGFPSFSQFCVSFKKALGMTPHEYKTKFISQKSTSK